MSEIKGYKVFNSDWTCRGFQYEVGKIFECDGNIEMCGKGFHFCRKASDCFEYYAFDSKNKVAEVRALGLVETQDNKSVTNKIEIVREIEWHELLDIVNEGADCTGLCNSGDCNSGNRNSGNRNSGDWNSGDWNSGGCNSGNWNSGDRNSGNRNSGNWNSGNRNSGNRNSGDWNSGDWNSGDWNSGDWNSGDWNSGNWNSGDRNSGNWNSGDRNSGNRNSGNWNSGNWNSGNFCSGFFNSKETPLYVFNKKSSVTRNEFANCQGVQILNWHYENSWWVYSQNMTDEEKSAHPEHETTGGYLKVVDFKEACALMWKNLDGHEKKAVTEIPHFNAKVFKEITGIDVKGE